MATEPTDKQKQEAWEIRLPFPCGCLDAHTGGGMAVREYTCETHRVIASALSSRDVEVREVLEGLRYRHGCWCDLPPNITSPDHTCECDAARGLWERVQAVNSRST